MMLLFNNLFNNFEQNDFHFTVVYGHNCIFCVQQNDFIVQLILTFLYKISLLFNNYHNKGEQNDFDYSIVCGHNCTFLCSFYVFITDQ